MTTIISSSSSFKNVKTFQEAMNAYNGDSFVIKKVKKSNLKSMMIDLGVAFEEVDSFDYANANVVVFWDGESLNAKKVIDEATEAGANVNVVRYENATNKSFRDEVENIHNPEWREACYKMLEQLPTYFWVVPASSSGKYHPSCDLGPGGLVRHSVMVCKMAVEFLMSELFIPNTDENQDKVRIAALFHDCMKQGKECTGHTVFDHPTLGAEFIKEHLNGIVDDESLAEICSAVASHMGKWNTSNYAPDVVLPIPSTEMEKLIHAADFTASRKFINGLEEWD